jgi:hypothetical protein
MYLLCCDKKTMSQKWPLFLGLLILTIGIVLKKSSDLSVLPILLMVLGVSLKVFYIISKSRTKKYRVGYELLVLAFGLVLFFTGLYFKKNGAAFNPYWLMGPGIVLKVIFVILFIRKTR